ncbi:glyceraldehyde-3-phosphate dehydrogenase-like protein [Leishmania major strain Friedlin]|uniref:Glyceraldehyde-3-phosphate dehydrogenase-like protein n=1 Tax=Leishmania major TaxID=5664 RepID=E9AFV0_LEIMA|nr:glyceraldehyde-3-phosphate dehydrogenase-like protein [Leishmania major strain Friedlin]CAG9582832.1 glyceraldehyde-3-phosphate_dehydrogenase-like_protein [Leishmania major strain Friedlin]CBZ13105.1 glyceraldehyde-3-phosphate dehydrogenase-like protein [Leishmania major strain Friedlin]|eukprot:XP_003722870.1 glyceraldehyde-3-phosphate dehydrogenase-like protein [Leishmania major strain Friedlin]
MSITVGINGFGPVGKSALFAALADPLFTVTAVVDVSVCAAYIAYVIEQEYPHRNPTGPPIRVTDKQKDQIVLNNTHVIHVSAAQDPQSSMWKKYGAQYVLECTGLYTTRSRSWGHVTGGAVGVFIAAASADTNTVMASSGLERLAASLPVCAAGAPIGAVVAPVLDALAKVLEIEQVSYTALYGPQPQHPIGAKSDDSRDWRQVRLQPFASCAMASSRDNGAETVGALLPHLVGRVSASAFQVPVAQGCAIDLVVYTKEAASADVVASAFAPAAADSEPLVKVCIANGPMISVDCIGSSSVILDATSLSSSTEGKVHRMVLWVDVACYYAALLLSLAKQVHSIHAPPSS